jgi:hypothetical protein
MWYNEEQETRGNEIIFPDGLKITAEDEDRSPVRGWEWHDVPPQWWNDINSDSNGMELQ